MNNYNNVSFNPGTVKVILWGIVLIAVFIVSMAFILPWYNVWSK